MEWVISPYTISYTGKLADEHVVNSEELGHSIIGASRISTAITHYIFSGRVPRGNYKREYQCVTTPPKEGSYEWSQYVIPIAFGIVQYPEGFRLGAELLFQTIWDGLKEGLTGGSTQKFEIMADTFANMNKDNQDAYIEAMKIFAQSVDSSNKNMSDVAIKQAEIIEQMSKHFKATMPELTTTQRINAINLVQPVGNSCTNIHNHFYGGFTVSIDSPEADLIRSKGQDTIGTETNFNCKRLTELNKNSGHCILELDGYDGNIAGQITDPVLSQPNNIYSAALHKHSPLVLKAKPVFRDGEIVKIHVSDAKEYD